MQHSFDIEIAKQYGIEEAVILNNIYYWIEKNRANGQHFYDGYYWTYNSVKAFNELFPYMSAKKIRNALKHLIDEEILITGNYNERAYDRTLWYALTEKGKSICLNGQMDFPKRANGSVQKGEPIPYINTDINTDNNIYSQNKDFDEGKSPDYEAVVKMYHDICKSFPKVMKLTDKRKKAIKARLKNYTLDDIKKVFEIAEQSEFLKGNNDRGWKADFDFLMTESKMIGVLEGKYNFANGRTTKASNIEVNHDFREQIRRNQAEIDDLLGFNV